MIASQLYKTASEIIAARLFGVKRKIRKLYFKPRVRYMSVVDKLTLIDRTLVTSDSVVSRMGVYARSLMCFVTFGTRGHIAFQTAVMF